MKIVLIADPEILAIPVKENHEPLVNLTQQSLIAYGPPPEIPNNTDYTFMRQFVYEKLLEAQNMLPTGIRFRLYEAYRSLALQEMLFTERYKKLQAANPSWSHDQLFIENTRLVSPVTNLDGSINVPPHSTGGAIDVCLIDEDGHILEMGLNLNDWMLDIDGSISITNSTKISKEAQRNRLIMNKVLIDAGFVNYPTEYWHWSYGDRYWAFHKKQPHAVYGCI